MNHLYNELIKQLLLSQKNIHDQNTRREFLVKVKQMLDNTKKEMKDVSLDAIAFQNKMNDIYMDIELKSREVNDLYKFIDATQIKIRNYENEIRKMKIRELDLLEKNKIDKKEQYQSQLHAIAIQRGILNHELEYAEQKRLVVENKLSIIHDYIHEYRQKLKEQHQIISDCVNKVLYLMILEKRLELSITDENNLSKVFDVMDKQPHVICFDDDVYMDIISKYNEYPDLLKDYIAKAESFF